MKELKMTRNNNNNDIINVYMYVCVYMYNDKNV